MDTQYYKNKNIECLNELIENYNIGLRLDDFGMGTEIYYHKELVGFWSVYHGGISFSFTKRFGGTTSVYSNWNELCAGVEDKLKH